MANVDMTEVHDYFEEYTSASEVLRESLLELRNNMRSLSGLNSFEGESASAVKNYLTDVHVETSVGYQDLIDSSKSLMKFSINLFHDMVDSDHSCIIKSDYIDSLEDDVKSTKDSLKSSVESVNKEIGTIADISSASTIDAGTITDTYDKLKKVTTDLLTHLTEFTSVQNGRSSNLEELLSNLNSVHGEMSALSQSGKGISGYSKESTGIDILGILKKGKSIRGDVKRGIKYSKAAYLWKITKDSKLIDRSKHYLSGCKYYLKDSKWSKMFGIKFLNTDGKARILEYKNGVITKEGKNIYKQLGFVDGDPKFLLNYGKGKLGVVKGVGKAAADGAKGSFKIIDYKGYSELGKFGKAMTHAGNVMSVAAVGLSAYDNYTEAKLQGLNTSQRIVSTTVNTGIDLAAAGAGAKVGMAIGGLVGGPLGIVVGVAAGYVIGKAAAPIVKGIKDGVNYVIKNGVSKSIDAAGKAVKETAKKVTDSVKNTVDNISNGFASIGKWAFG
ncbi:hypothetical protein I6N96_01795 [Enterococcus sp. BWM-S5]|uniref:LXG domain-containing protein n=1 Tax=Enterococcus larvae TaxID=2794352 RepID=A0ABS4CG61_9ENTE|nr:T7SS effector LXG polymorphic toxin [Enterococcus larvae]MBP1044995.1 hypothetical protein [Enterococcus larvae]